MLLNGELETIDEECFAESGLERVSIPVSVKNINYGAFRDSHLVQARFLGAENDPHCGHSSGNA